MKTSLSALLFLVVGFLAAIPAVGAAERGTDPRLLPASAFGPEGHHWHLLAMDNRIMIVADGHRVAAGKAPHHKQILLVAFSPTPADAFGDSIFDYSINLAEFDCSSVGMARLLAVASYDVKASTTTPMSTSSTPSPWKRGVDNGVADAWDWVCQDKKNNQSVESNLSFYEMLERYRDIL